MLDPMNVRLLRALADDPRLSMSALARTVGMSAPAVTERIQRLEWAGVIRGYRLDIDPSALGLPVTAWVRVRPASGQLSTVAQLAQRLTAVVECHRVTGEDCFLMKMYVADLAELERVLDQFLRYGQTTSSLVVSSPVRPRRPPLPDERG